MSAGTGRAERDTAPCVAAGEHLIDQWHAHAECPTAPRRLVSVLVNSPGLDHRDAATLAGKVRRALAASPELEAFLAARGLSVASLTVVGEDPADATTYSALDLMGVAP